MMTTSYPHGGVMHPQGIPPGHPMGGPGPNPGQQMPPGMQHVSGPNGPVSQAGPMMGMQPGMGPNAHALSHLQPQQAHMFQQQQQMMNPAMIQQHRNAQQQAYMRQQQQQAMLAQHQGGMGMGFQNPMANMNPQQMAAIRAGQMGQPFVNLPQHLQLHQQQQMQNQQQGGPQQAAALAQAQHQAAQHQAQQQQHMQQQQAIAMQHAQSQSSNHSQAGNQGPPTTSQPQQGPLRPPSAIGSHQGQSSPAPQPTPQQVPQQPPQQQQPQQQPPQSGPVQQQTPAPAQPPNLPQQPNQQPQNQVQMQQRHQANSVNPVMVQQAQVQAQAQANAQAAQARSMVMMKQAQQQQQQQQQGGQGTLRLMNFVDQIGRYTANRGDSNEVSKWQTFVDKFFTETGSFVHIVCLNAQERSKQFEIVYAALPRYFYTLFNTDVTNLQITLDGATEKASPPELKVTCDRAKFIYTYRNQCQVVYHGKLTAFWSGSEKMEWLQFEGQGHQQYIPRGALEQMFHQPSPNQMNPNQSPRMNKSAKQKLQQRAAQEPPEPYLPMSKLPSAGITELGLPHALQGYLEIYETMNNMTSLMTHYLEHSNMKPTEALESWNTMMSNTTPIVNATNPNSGQPNPGMQQPNMPPGARAPGPGQAGPMFMSPAMPHQLLPNGAMNGSPGMMHTPSPASHAMVKQQSTSSHTASVNTSPNINNKRRRSTAKIEIDDGSGDMNGAPKVKQSPRVGGGKRMKAGGN